MPSAQRNALILSHVGFEDLGSLRNPLLQRGFSLKTIDVADGNFPFAEAQACDLLVVLGGPIGVYEQADYPFLKDEIQALKERFESRKPILGICLGAQLMAAALGSRVYPGKNGKEIGWAPILIAPNVRQPEWFLPILTPGLHLFHWHGDTFDLPPGANLLASTEHYMNQAFTLGTSALGLQFHPEVTAEDLESWYVGHAAELHHAGISVADLRAAAAVHAPRLEIAAQALWNQWLDYIL